MNTYTENKIINLNSKNANARVIGLWLGCQTLSQRGKINVVLVYWRNSSFMA